MKRIAFYTVLFIQIIVLSLLAIQYNLIDRTDKEVQLLLQDRTFYSESTPIYINYEIQEIPKEKWDIEVDQEDVDSVYVLLEQGENGISNVSKVVLEKPNKDAAQAFLKASFSYENRGMYHVHYESLQRVMDERLIEGIESDKALVATIKIAPWGQSKITSIENIAKE